MNIREAITRAVANGMVSQRDEAILSALRKFTGVDDLTITDLSLVDIVIEQYPGGHQIVRYQGNPVIELYPPTMNMASDPDGTTKMTMTQRYRVF